VSGEALLAAGYSAFLLIAALCLDALARHSHRRSGRYRTAGFSFHHELDAWRCPEGEFLKRVELDEERRLVRYRARAAVCNACPAKADCTDSDQGREVVQPIDPWPHSEAGRFHRGIAVAICVLGALVAAVALTRNSAPADLALLGAMLALALLVGLRLGRVFLASPSGFPSDDPSLSFTKLDVGDFD
jgi:hypothetical protein